MFSSRCLRLVAAGYKSIKSPDINIAYKRIVFVVVLNFYYYENLVKFPNIDTKHERVREREAITTNWKKVKPSAAAAAVFALSLPNKQQ